MSYLDLDTIHTPASGGTATYGWGTQVRDNAEWQIEPRHCVCDREITHNSSGSFQSVSFSTAASEVRDNDTMHSTGSNQERVTITTSGIYRVTGHIIWDANSTGYRELRLSHSTMSNLPRDIIESPHASVDVGQTVQWEGPANAAGYFYLEAYQNSGGNLDYRAWITVRRVARQ